jgi:hypothetical protein
MTGKSKTDTQKTIAANIANSSTTGGVSHNFLVKDCNLKFTGNQTSFNTGTFTVDNSIAEFGTPNAFPKTSFFAQNQGNVTISAGTGTITLSNDVTISGSSTLTFGTSTETGTSTEITGIVTIQGGSSLTAKNPVTVKKNAQLFIKN